MIRTYILSAFVASTLLSCSTDYEPVIKETPDERVKEAIEEYRSTLLSAPHGWKAYISTGSGRTYFFYFDFNEDGSVTMASDFSAATGEPMSATYAMKGLQRPTLSFDTYSHIHILADPDGTVNGGQTGVGLASDFEFALESNSGDSLVLVGIKLNTPMQAVQATQEEANDFMNGMLADVISATDDFLVTSPYPYLQTDDDEIISLSFDQVNRVLSFFILTEDNGIIQFASSFIYTTTGIRLLSPLTYGGINLSEFFWDASSENFFVPDGNSERYLMQSTSPAIPLVYTLGYVTTFIGVDPAVTEFTPEFLSIYQAAAEGLLQTSYELVLDAFSISFNQSDEMIFTVYIHDEDGNYYYDMIYSMQILPDQSVNFQLIDNGGIPIIVEALGPLVSYFEDNTFTFDYVQDSDNVYAGVYPEGMPDAYFYGPFE